MISPTADAGRTPTQRTTPPIETFLRVIVVSFVALILFAIPREGAVQPPLATRVIVGSGIGGQSKVRVFDGTTAAPLPGPLGSFTALTQNPGGEVRVAACDFNNDGTDDIIVSPGLGKQAEVRVFNGVTGLPFPAPLGSFQAFATGFLGGVHLACGDLTGDSIPDIIAARGAVGKPEVRVFNGVTAAPLPPPLGSFFAFNQTFLGGVRVAGCDLNQDGKTDIVAARGPLAQPEIRAFDGLTGNVFPPPLGSFLAFSASDRGGVYVACGDLTGDTIPDIIAGKGLGQPPTVRVFNGVTAAPLPPPFGSFLAFSSTFPGGVRVASCDLNQDGRNDIIAGRGPGAQPEVRAFDGVSGTPFPPPLGSFLAFGATFKGGVYVACSPNDSGGGGGPPETEKAPEVASTIPTNGATGVTTNSNLTITFDEDVAVTGDWFQISCPTSGPRNVTLANTVVSGGSTTWTINPNTDFAPNEICSTTIVAAQIADLDTSDPPENMLADFTFGFTTEAAPSVSSTVPPNGATGVAVDSNITVTFSEPVTTTASTFGLECPAGSPVGFVVSPAPPGNTTSYTLNPNDPLPAGTCTIKVTATQVTDVDTNDPPDTMVTDFTSTFTSGANNPPSFTKGPDQSVAENAPAQNVSPWATAIDDGDPAVTQALTFNITGNTNPSLFSAGPSVSSTGDLTYTPATNQSGTASITLTLSDDGGTPGTPGDDATSPPQTFTITVNAVNNAPSFVVGPDQSVNEDASAQSVSPWATAIDDGDPESTQNVSFIITGNTNPSLFSAGPSVSSSGALSYTPAANAFGSATITLVLKDDGGTANPGDNDTSPPQSFTITINAVNDPPSFTVGPNQSVFEDAGLQSVNPWATAISPGPPNESGQTVSFIITSNTNPTLFSAGPSVTPGGALSYTPAANANGGASIQLVIKDSGGGTDTSAPQGFTITVTAVNDPPQVTPPAAYPAHAHIAINIPDGASDLFDGSTITDVDGAGAAPFSITAAGPFASASGGSVTIAANGSFSYNPPAGFTGANDTFTFQICDSGVPLPSACTNATATVAVSGPRVWFVDNTAPAGGNGRLSNPFNTLTAADTAASASTDRTFVFTSGITYTGGFGFLGSQQRLIGQGVVDTDFDTALGITPPATSVARPVINGTRPTINGTITLAIGSTARGFNVNNTTAPGVSGSGATGLTVNQVSVTTTTGTAVSLTSNSGGTVSFTSVSSNGAPNGILLNTTTGSFTVTGSGGNCSIADTTCTGGTIQNTTGSGIQLTSAANVSLTRMRIRTSGVHGINGSSGVSGLTLNTSLLDANGNGDNEHGVNLVDATGTFLIDATTVHGAAEDLVQITNTNTNLTLTVQNGSHFEYPNPKGSAFANSAILLRPFGSSALTVSVQGNTFKNIVNNSLLMGGDNAVSGTRTATFSNNTVTVDAALNQSCGVNPECRVGGVVISARNSSTTNFVATGNTFTRASGAGVIELGSNETATLKARVENNNISNSLGDGFKIGSFQASRMILQFNGNTLTNIGGDGFEVAAGESVTTASTDMDLVITNNTINGHTQNPAIQFVGGFGVFRFGDPDQLLCLKLTGNTVTNTPINFFDVYLDGNFGALGGNITYEGSGTGAVTTARIKADNPGVTEANVNVSATNLSNATCQLPGI